MVIKQPSQCGNDAFPKYSTSSTFPKSHESPDSTKSRWLLPRAALLFAVVFLCNSVGHVGSDGPHLGRSFHVKHLIVKVDVRSDLLQHGALGCPCKEQGLVDLQAPGPEGLQCSDPRTGCASSSDQVCSDGAVESLAFGIELLLELSKGLQKALQGTLPEDRE